MKEAIEFLGHWQNAIAFGGLVIALIFLEISARRRKLAKRWEL